MKYEHLLKVIKVADHLGVDIIRTYIPITLNSIEERRTGCEGKYDLGKIRLDFDPAVFDEAVVSLQQIIPVLKKTLWEPIRCSKKIPRTAIRFPPSRHYAWQ